MGGVIMSGTKIWNGDGMSMDKRFQSTRKTVVFGPQEKKTTSKTVNIILADKSFSLADPIGHGDSRQKIIGVKESITSFLINLPSTAMISVIAFGSTVERLWNIGYIGDNKIKIIQLIQALRPWGSTAMKQALIEADKELLSAAEGFDKRIFLLTDGIPNTDPREIAKNIKAKGVQLYTIGFGDGNQIDDALLKEMASIGPAGTPLYYHFKDAKQLTGFMTRVSRKF